MDSLWQRRPIGELLSTDIDYRGKTPPESDSGIPTISAANVKDGRVVLNGDSFVSRETYQEWLTRGKPQSGDVLITTEAPVGEVALFPDGGPYLPTRRVIAMRCKDEVASNRFLKYSLQCNDTQRRLRSNTRGSTVSRVLKEDIFGLEIGVPPLAVQRRIADILGALDDKIELNRRMNETLEEMAQTLYRHWFVDFGPFQDQEFKDTELGRIPKGWEVGELGDFCTINRETVDKDNPPDPFEYIKISGVNEGRVEETEVMPWEGAPTRANRRVQDGDVVWSKVRPNRKGYFLCLEPPDNLVVSTGFATITPDELPFSWVYLILTTEDFVDYLTARATGAAYPSVTLDAFRNAEVVIPKTVTLEAFHEKIEPLFRLQQSNTAENDVLSETRDYLLPKLISGKIEVEAAQEVVEAEM